jgi:hypothetical protein
MGWCGERQASPHVAGIDFLKLLIEGERCTDGLMRN